MNDITNKAIVLKLNSKWQAVGYGIVADAIVDLVAGGTVKALDIQYDVDDNGDVDFNKTLSMIPVDWDTWCTLPIRPWDFVIHSSRLTVRVPTITICRNFHNMPMKMWKGRPSKDAIYERDGGIDQYTGKHLDKKNATIDHVHPKSRGGSNDWTNLALTNKELNHRKGNSLNSEIGLTLLRPPVAPKPVPISTLLRDIRHQDWKLFIN